MAKSFCYWKSRLYYVSLIYLVHQAWWFCQHWEAYSRQSIASCLLRELLRDEQSLHLEEIMLFLCLYYCSQGSDSVSMVPPYIILHIQIYIKLIPMSVQFVRLVSNSYRLDSPVKFQYDLMKLFETVFTEVRYAQWEFKFTVCMILQSVTLLSHRDLQYLTYLKGFTFVYLGLTYFTRC